ncbi:F0F1 ATP synthase subunit B [Rhodobacteraceae bacterium LMO-12]|nr:F0F1 ATP synthase subunit B [Rhodobacteraceae bacterium LMO-JJ12]
MSIDWITVAAQIANFLVLVWLLKRFLYRPILDGIDAREREIAARMAEAATLCEAAEAAKAEHKAEIEGLQSGREDLLAQAREAAEAERDAVLRQARERLERERLAREEERIAETRRFRADLQHKGATALVALTRKALNDLAGETLEERIVARAATRLSQMTGDLTAAAGDGREAVITTRDTLRPQNRRQLEDQLKKAMPAIEVTFKTDPGQSPGLNLRLGGAQLGWSVDSYVEGLQDILDEQAERKEHANAA